MHGRYVGVVGLLLLLGFAGGAVAPAGAAEWEKERDRERKGFTVWSRPVEGSEYPEYMVELHVDAPAAAVWAVLTDWEAEFFPRVALRRVIDTGGDGVVVYQRDDCDPLPPRDYALRFHVRSASEPYELVAGLANELAPAPTEGIVRVTDHRHRWTVRSDGDGSVAVLIIHHDPVDVLPKLYRKGFLSCMADLRRGLERAARER